MKPNQTVRKPKLMIFNESHPWLGPALWILTIEYFLIQILVAAAWPGGYDWSRNAISDLGTTSCDLFMGHLICSPLAWLMNISFVVLGLLMALGSLLIYQGFRPSGFRLSGFVLMALAGVGALMVGVFPSNEAGLMHGIGAALVLLVGNIALLVLGCSLPLARLMRFFSWLMIGLAWVGIGLFFVGNPFGFGLGALERLVAYPQTIWLIVFGVYISSDRYRGSSAKA